MLQKILFSIIALVVIIGIAAPFDTHALQSLRKKSSVGTTAKTTPAKEQTVSKKLIPEEKFTRALGIVKMKSSRGTTTEKKRPMMQKQELYAIETGTIMQIDNAKKLAVVQMSRYTVDIAVGTDKRYQMKTIVQGKSRTINGVTVEYLGSVAGKAVLRIQ